MRLASRLLAMLLAVLPAVWGNCPCWFVDAQCCVPPPAASKPSDAPVERKQPDSCCARCHSKKGPEAPVAPGRDAPAKDRDCEACPVLDVRDASTGVPAVAGLPAPAEAGPALATVVSALAPALHASPLRARGVPWPGGGGAPRSVETTFLRI